MLKLNDLFLILIALLPAPLLLGQVTEQAASFAIEQHLGKLIKIHSLFPDHDISYTQRIGYNLATNPDSSWNYLHGRALTGFSFSHSTFGNDLILGRAVSLTYQVYLHRPISRNIRLFVMPSGGLSWFNKPYDIVENPSNLVIGSSFTGIGTIQTGMDFRMHDSWQLRLGGSFYHYSNSHVAVPNIGANVFSGFLGLRYAPNGLPESLTKAERIAKRQQPTNWRPMVRVRLGLHEFPGTITPRDGPLYKVGGLTVGMITTSESRARWSFGLTYDYYEGYATYLVSQQLFDDVENVNWLSSSLAVFAGREWCFGRTHFFTELSGKFYSPIQKALKEVWDLPKGSSYSPYVDARIGYRYYIIPRKKAWHEVRGAPNIGVAIKTNGGAADFLEFSLGYTL